MRRSEQNPDSDLAETSRNLKTSRHSKLPPEFERSTRSAPVLAHSSVINEELKLSQHSETRAQVITEVESTQIPNDFGSRPEMSA